MSEIVELPSLVAFESGAKITLRRGSVVLRSRYTGKRQVLSLPYALWVFEGRLVPVEGTDAADWRAFLVDLEGQANTFRLPVPGYTPTSGYAANASRVDGPGQTGRVLNVKGITPGAVYLRRGDMLTVGDELKVVSETVSANAQGKAVVTFRPRLRKSPASDAHIETSKPYMHLSSQDDDAASWELSRPVQHGINLSGIEAVE